MNSKRSGGEGEQNKQKEKGSGMNSKRSGREGEWNEQLETRKIRGAE